ncbi:MAG: PD-(D/E)XK nuclease domain-containing protein, partial [Microscillaceae bacterium]|nr:PD-(D/E)XK nuclease domain-containing protein [Microscillaceae bacterium]
SSDFISLLYYMGYLTLRETNAAGVTRLEMPNYVIQKLYLDFLVNLLKQKEDLQIPSKAVGEAIEKMAIEGNIQPFFQIIAGILEHLSNRDYQDFDEKYIKAIIMGIALTYPLYFIVSERESKNGYMDLLFLQQVPYTPQFQFAFELKYLKKKDEKKLQATQETAKNQLFKYMEGKEQLKNQVNVQAYTIVVVKSKIYLEKVG